MERLDLIKIQLIRVFPKNIHLSFAVFCLSYVSSLTQKENQVVTNSMINISTNFVWNKKCLHDRNHLRSKISVSFAKFLRAPILQIIC